MHLFIFFGSLSFLFTFSLLLSFSYNIKIRDGSFCNAWWCRCCSPSKPTPQNSFKAWCKLHFVGLWYVFFFLFFRTLFRFILFILAFSILLFFFLEYSAVLQGLSNNYDSNQILILCVLYYVYIRWKWNW